MPRYLLLVALTATFGAAETEPGAQSVIVFSGRPLYAFLSWDQRAVPVDGGLGLQAPNSQGGMGFLSAADLAPFASWTPRLSVTRGAGHQAKAIRVILSDADGTSHEYRFGLEPLGAAATAAVLAQDGASVADPSRVGDAGKQAGFDLAHLAQVSVQGDWSSNPVDLVLHKLELVAPTPAILAAREQLRQRRAAAAERERRAAEATAKRKQELLAGAPHPADGPDLRHVSAVAPDILALWVQEKELVAAPQVPYVPQEGDAIRHSGDEQVWVIEQGEIRQAPKTVAVYRRQGNREVKVGDLAINAGMLKPEERATGQDLTVETVAEPAAYRVSGVDDPAWPAAAAPAEVWWKRKPNGFRSLTHQVEIFLKLPRSLAEGRTYRIELPGVNFRQAAVEYRHEPSRTRSGAVHVSAIGFRPDDPFKGAWLSQWLGTGGALRYPPDQRFSLLDDATGQVVFRGQAQPLSAADQPESFKAGRNYNRTDVLGLDFSAFGTPGRYRVLVDGIGCSDPFDIAADVWSKAFQLSMRGLLHHRSGLALGPPVTDYVRPRDMHPADGVRVFASRGSELESGSQDGAFRMLARERTERELPEAWGGHKDAGDWDRNTLHPAAFWILLDLYELYPQRLGAIQLALPPDEAGNGLPDILDEVIWNLDLYRRLQTPEGGVRGGIESTSHPRPGEASWQESLLLSAYAPDPRASLVYAAGAAKLARLLPAAAGELSRTYAASARRAWDWAVAQTPAFLAKATGDRQRAAWDKDLRTRRNLAALELWLLTGDTAFHDEFRATTILGDANIHIYEQIKAILRYARLPEGQGDPDLRAAARQKVLAAADNCLKFAAGNGFGVTVGVPTLPPMGFVGYLSVPETSLGAVLPTAWLLTGDARYLAGAVRACQFAAGANPDNQALTTGLGPRPVRFPLHIDSLMTGQPAPAGITVYGISDPAENYGFDAWAYTWYLQRMVPAARTWPASEMYWDIWVVPSTNEYTIHQTIIPTAACWGFLAARP